jgi:hypothetical protein
MPYFHVSPQPLVLGTDLQPGAWGRVTRQFSRPGRALESVADAKVLAWETALELARQTTRPEAVSRLDCVFACETLEDATAFRDRFRQGAAIYEVEPLNEGTPTYRADYDLITATGDAAFLDIWVERSRAYWQQEPAGLVEVLIGGVVRVMRQV